MILFSILSAKLMNNFFISKYSRVIGGFYFFSVIFFR